MRSQRRGWRHAEDEVETVGAAEVDRLRRAIMAVATQQDFGLGPMAANGAQQAAQQGPDLLAAGPSGGTQNGGDEAAGAIEHDDRLKAVFVIVRIEQPQLLAAVDGVEHVVDVEGDALGDLRERFAIEVDHGAAHAQQRAGVRQIFQTRDRRLRTQIAVRRRKIMRHLEDRIDAKAVGVVAVLVAPGDHQQAKTNDVGERVRDLLRRTRIDDAGGQAFGDAKTLLDLAQNQHAGVRRQQPAVELGDDLLGPDR